MKIYVCGRFQDIEKIKNINNLLRKHGHTITLDWTSDDNIKPYDKNELIAKKRAIEDINGVEQSDVFIMITHPEVGGGSSVELGVAILSYLIRRKPRIYMIGKYNSSVLFYYHPSILKRATIQEVLEDIKD